MKWLYLFAALVLTAVFGLPFRAYDTGKLLPVRTVQAARTARGVKLVSEIGQAEGESWTEAVAALREQAPGDVFFDTAEQLVVCAPSLLPEILRSGELRPAAQVYFAEELTDPEGLNEYLTAHKSELTVADLRYALLREGRL
ncbi:MAG: hypothetical protein IJG45_02095 [Oscillospiraceae bacterium]|nr:hypothetical protein [Oscillospiraceae bacterium]